MKKIIVPTDFSSAADNALAYAKGLAQHGHLPIELVHVFYPAVELNNGYMIDPSIETDRRVHLEKAALEAKTHASAEVVTTVDVTPRFIVGFPVEEIVNLSKEEDTLIVMGATGASGVLGRLFGSVSSNVTKQAHSPVILVPTDAQFSPYAEIMYASETPELDSHLSGMITGFANRFDAKLHCVHVGKDGDVYPEDKMQAIFGELTTHPILVKKHFERADVISGLNEYAEENAIDLLMMGTKQRRFWDSLFHVSMTKEMALRPRLPIMVIHDHDN